jgi:hypothetical protein
MKTAPALNHERLARRDPRVWGALATGCALLGALLVAPALNEAPLLEGPGLLVWTALRRMQVGASRGTRFDATAQTFHWWNGRDPRARGSIPAQRLRRIVIDESGDTLQIRMYDTDGAELEGFREWCLPPRYTDWIAAVQTVCPHVDVATLTR